MFRRCFFVLFMLRPSLHTHTHTKQLQHVQLAYNTQHLPVIKHIARVHACVCGIQRCRRARMALITRGAMCDLMWSNNYFAGVPGRPPFRARGGGRPPRTAEKSEIHINGNQLACWLALAAHAHRRGGGGLPRRWSPFQSARRSADRFHNTIDTSGFAGGLSGIPCIMLRNHEKSNMQLYVPKAATAQSVCTICCLSVSAGPSARKLYDECPMVMMLFIQSQNITKQFDI